MLTRAQWIDIGGLLLMYYVVVVVMEALSGTFPPALETLAFHSIGILLYLTMVAARQAWRNRYDGTRHTSSSGLPS